MDEEEGENDEKEDGGLLLLLLLWTTREGECRASTEGVREGRTKAWVVAAITTSRIRASRRPGAAADLIVLCIAMALLDEGCVVEGGEEGGRRSQSPSCVEICSMRRGSVCEKGMDKNVSIRQETATERGLLYLGVWCYRFEAMQVTNAISQH